LRSLIFRLPLFNHYTYYIYYITKQKKIKPLLNFYQKGLKKFHVKNYKSSCISPVFIQPSFLNISLKAKAKIAGRTMHTSASPTHIIGDHSVEVITPIGPTIPQVPIPAETPEHLSLNIIVEIGPVTAAASVGASQIIGFLTILPI
jgi:hypothetical protein